MENIINSFKNFYFLFSRHLHLPTNIDAFYQIGLKLNYRQRIIISSKFIPDYLAEPIFNHLNTTHKQSSISF